MVPNVLQAYAFDIDKLNAFTGIYNDLMLADSGLSKLEREMIAVVVSSINRCFYCLVAHGAAVREMSGDPMLGEVLVMNYASPTLIARQRAMLDFADKLITTASADDRGNRPAGAARSRVFRPRYLGHRERRRVLQHDQPRGQRHGMRPTAEYHAQASMIALASALFLALTVAPWCRRPLTLSCAGWRARDRAPVFAAGQLPIPLAVYRDGGGCNAGRSKGAVTRTAWRMDAARSTTLQILAPLRDQVLADGFERGVSNAATRPAAASISALRPKCCRRPTCMSICDFRYHVTAIDGAYAEPGTPCVRSAGPARRRSMCR